MAAFCAAPTVTFRAALWVVFALHVPGAFATVITVTPPGGSGLGITNSAAVIVIPGNTRQPVLYLQLPNSLALQQGVSMSIDDGPVAPPLLQSCDGNGCYATLTLTPGLLESMKTGK